MNKQGVPGFFNKEDNNVISSFEYTEEEDKDDRLGPNGSPNPYQLARDNYKDLSSINLTRNTAGLLNVPPTAQPTRTDD